MKKILFNLLLFIGIIAIYNNVNADSNLLPVNEDNSYICYLNANGFEEKAFSINGLKNTKNVYKLTLGGKPALCLNYDIGTGVSYIQVGRIPKNFISTNGQKVLYAEQFYKLWNYANNGNYYDAQLALWAMVKKNISNWNPVIFLKPSQNIESFKKSGEVFLNFYETFKNIGGQCVSNYGIQQLSMHKNSYDKDNPLVSIPMGDPKPTGDSDRDDDDDDDEKYADTTFLYDCEIFSLTEKDFVDKHSSYDKNLVQEYYRRILKNYGTSTKLQDYLNIGISEKTSNGEIDDRNVLITYNNIVTTSISNTELAIWCPAEDKNNSFLERMASIGGQCIIAPANISCENCSSSVIREKTKNPNLTNKQIYDKLKGKYSQLTYDEKTNKLSCKTEECKEINTYVKYYKKAIDPNALKKYSRFATEYGFKVITTSTGLVCGKTCSTEKAQFLTTYGGSCEKFKNALDDKSSIKKCVDNELVECSELPPDEPEPDDCEPYIEEYACLFPSQDGGFYMSDTGEKGADNRACYYDKGYGYRLNGTTYASDTDNFGNEYCAIKCWEAFGGDFPGAVKGLAGQVLYWGRGSYYSDTLGSANAYRYCYTENINYSKFSSDWNASEAAILNAYNSWSNQNQYVSNDVIASGACTIDQPRGRDADVRTKICCSADCDAHCDKYNGDFADGTCCYKTVAGSYHDCPSGFYADGGTCKKAGTNYKKNKVGDSTDGGTRCIANDITDKNAEYNNVTGANTELTARKNTLVNLEKNRQALYTKITSCSTNTIVNENSIYKFTTEATLKFEDPKINSRNVNAKLPYEDVTQMFSSNGTPNGSSVSFWCNNIGNFQTFTSCNALINQYSNYHWEVEKIRLFKYPSNMRWIAMMQNYELKNDMNNNETYHYIGYGIPTAFGTATGYYGGTGNDNLKGQLSLVITGFGHNGHFDALVDTMESGTGNSYSYACPYYVKNEITQHECNYLCDDGTRTCKLVNGSPVKCNNGDNGLDLVYRVIDMAAGDQKRIFPSIDGDGRSAGANWATFINTQAEAFKNITTYSTIYDNKPIYHIDLTPTMISDIRNSNKEYRNASIDPYASYKTVNNTNKIKCNNKSGANKSCISKYITDLIKKYPNNITGEYVSINENSRLNAIDCGKSRYNTSNITTCKAN